jgi:hypothetical protein
MALTLISTHTASASATLDITSGIDSTYDSYEFHFVNMHPATDQVNFQFQVNTGFNQVMTTTTFDAYHFEDDSDHRLVYEAFIDQAQTQLYQTIGAYYVGNDNDQSVSGVLRLFDPSSTTYVKQFTADGNGVYYADASVNLFTAGYINTTSAIDKISFKFSSGNIDAGTIKMFGVT